MRGPFPKARGLIALAAFLTFPVWSQSSPACGEKTPLQEDRKYNQLFPLHIKECVSAHRPDRPHSFMYIKGACPDEKAAIPQLKECFDDPSIPLTDPDAGTAVSPGSIFKNSLFVLTRGISTMMDGGSGLTRPPSEREMDFLAEAYLKQGSFRGLKFHEKFTDPEIIEILYRASDLRGQGKSEDIKETIIRSLLARQSLGLHYAVALKGPVTCVNIPVTREEIRAVIDYYNHLNQSGEKFDLLTHNCAHITGGALAVLGILKKIPSGGLLRKGVVSPGPVVADTLYRVQFDKLDPQAVYEKKSLRENILAGGPLPTRPGSVLWEIGKGDRLLWPSFLYKSSSGQVSSHLYMKDLPFAEFYNNDLLFNAEKNRDHFQSLLGRSLGELDKILGELEKNTLPSGKEKKKREFFRAYKKALEKSTGGQ